MLGKAEPVGRSPTDPWEGLGIPDFLRLTPEERKAAWARNPAAHAAPSPKSLWSGTSVKRPFHIPKGVEPEGLKLFEEEECEKARKKTERLAVLKALPKRPRIKRKPRRAKDPPKRKGKGHVARNHKSTVRACARSPKRH